MRKLIIPLLVLMVLSCAVSATFQLAYNDTFTRSDNETIGNFEYPVSPTKAWVMVGRYPEWNTYNTCAWRISGNTTYFRSTDGSSVKCALHPTDFYANDTVRVQYDIKLDFYNMWNPVYYNQQFRFFMGRTNQPNSAGEFRLNDDTYAFGVDIGNLSTNTSQTIISIWNGTNTTSIPASLGQWYRIDIIARPQFKTADVFVNGTLVANNLTYSGYGYTYFNLADFIDHAQVRKWGNIDNFSILYTPYCAPNWNCSSYECQPDNFMHCNGVTDLNVCGTTYGGNYSEFNATVPCEYCNASWWCSDWNCTIDDIQYCINASDYHYCNESYTGNFSEFNSSSCDYCTPAFLCTSYNETCESLKQRSCLQVNDTNNCYYQTYLPSDAFNGSLSDFDLPCGYQPRYDKSDLLPIGKDAFGRSLYSILLVLGAIIAILILILFVNMLTKRGVKI